MDLLRDKNYWDSEWVKIFDRYQNDTRFAHYLYAFLESNEKKIIEIGAGSFRDMAKINNWGLECYGIDFSDKSVEKAKMQFPEYENFIIQADAFQLPFNDKCFDVSYHNGFWSNFSNNDEINLLVSEQYRVTSKRMMVAVHNAHNASFVEYFNNLKTDDPLYTARFFTISEVTYLLEKYCDDIKIVPVGKGKKLYEDYLINLDIGTPENLRKCFNYHQMDLLESSERLLCIGTVKSKIY
ncbi:class I SAM-dependent methyltransferase [Anabaenopsis arnoldii]|uniref:Class I SAM-dependent methyltransferase n=1 Tax=Anabaenopsis arnoldii TaxID=2152938 RepID=A0ABT5APF8_9CYAN|nr:class I SAM-dependent methyltransferase [Anabaenopsis arnoldii]MDB9538588.1 class I SAM-dependent methyltransferase [Anabaenopsis arnoldii]MDH6090861.1 class I SAM-dependent methyltransferase [Anabaenopsis arnoldii]